MSRRRTEASLARRADGTLDERRRDELARELQGSPELAGELELQQQALTLMGQLGAEQAPPELHAGVAALVDSRAASPSRPRRGWRPVAVGALTVAVVVVLVAVLVSGSGSGAPTVNQAALLALSQPTQPSPAESPTGGTVLERSEGGIRFPYWQHELGWTTSGARTDSFAGRSASTVFYTAHSPSGTTARVGYTILSGTALPLPKGTAVEQRGTRYVVLSDDRATVVTWRRNGHTCILAARGVGPGTLLHLAAWA